jgi:hypothetical protein
MKVVRQFGTLDYKNISEKINTELGKLYKEYPNGDLVDIKYLIDTDNYHSVLIIFETEKPEFNPLILNQIIESLKG